MEERLQKYMAKCGVASRRKCEEIIISGRVSVDGKVITELGYKIIEGINKVYLDGTLIIPEEKKVYIMLNKPKGIISAVTDDRGRRTVVDLINVKERIYPIGRLDYDTSGLLLLTNDGNVYNKLMHPSKEINKTYIAKVKGVPSTKEMHSFRQGLKIEENYITSKADIEILKKEEANSILKIIIHEGRNRQVRKMCSCIGHEVLELKREQIGELKLQGLKLGEYRNLTSEELHYINNLSDS